MTEEQLQSYYDGVTKALTVDGEIEPIESIKALLIAMVIIYNESHPVLQPQMKKLIKDVVKRL